MDDELYIEVLSSKIEDMKKLCDDKIILQFYNDQKHKIFHTYDFNKKIAL